MSKIEWTGQTWNPIAGCSLASPGCTNCYAMKMAARLDAMSVAHAAKHGGDPGPLAHYRGLTQPSKAGPVWTGQIAVAPDHVLLKPMRRRKPTMYFVNSMSDIFHPDVPDAVIDRIFAVMALCPQHIFQVLTKRSERMRDYLSARNEVRPDCPFVWAAFNLSHLVRGYRGCGGLAARPLPNVWLGVSVEDAARKARIDDLRNTAAATRFISFEPLLGDVGPVDLTSIGWAIVGGESGPGARPMHPDWARNLRDQCVAAGVPFFFKQWGDWFPVERWEYHVPTCAINGQHFAKIGKKAAGRTLDGVIHSGMPA